jgi:uncharacterized protein YbjT (DUF2867 family)
MDVLVLGAGGGLGRLICAELREAGHAVRTIAQRRDARDAGALAAVGARAIVNCAGASVAVGLGHGWRGYRAVDTPIGLAAAEAARRTGARLVYVAVHHTPAFARCAYVDAHERVAAAMQDLDGVVVRATGFYSAYAALLPMARRGTLFDIGDGQVRTNPIDERDLAAIVAESVAGEGPREIAAGGPQIMTRRAIFEHVAAVAGRPVKIRGMPVWMASAAGAVLRLAHPRIGQFVQFAALLARHEAIAPALGTRTLADYLAEAATADRRTGPTAPPAPPDRSRSVER